MPGPIPAARLLTDELLKENESHFCFLADHLPAPVWIANADGWIYWYNRRWFEYTGTSEKEMEGWGWQAVHDQAVPPSVLDKWKVSIATGEPFEMVFPIRGADGVFQTFLTRVNPVCDGNGKILRWIGIHSNISGQRQAEVLLLEKNALLNTAFRQTYSYMMILTADGTIVEVNDTALQAATASRMELVGKKLWDGTWWNRLPEEVQKLKAAVSKAASGESVREECRYMLSDGTIRFTDRTLSPVKDHDRAIGRLVATGIDITEQKELRERLEDRVKARTRALEEKNEQLADLSGRLLRSQDEERRRIARDLHDSVGQLLAALSMNIGMVQSQAHKLTPQAATALKENYEIVQQISKEIRTISQLLHPPLLDEIGLLSSLRSYAEGFAERSKVKVTVDFPGRVEEVPHDMELPIFRIVQECLTNVYRHSESPTAFISITPTPGQIAVQVRDQGKGIPAMNGRMHGVGLSGMRERVRELGGSLEVQSNEKGTTVTAILPVARWSAAKPGGSAAE
jgi:PAS domain S-box-containing protein